MEQVNFAEQHDKQRLASPILGVARSQNLLQRTRLKAPAFPAGDGNQEQVSLIERIWLSILRPLAAECLILHLTIL